MPLSAFAISLAAQAGSQPGSATSPTSAESLSNLARILSALTVNAVEIVVVAVLCGALYGVTVVLLRTLIGESYAKHAATHGV